MGAELSRRVGEAVLLGKKVAAVGSEKMLLEVFLKKRFQCSK